jgi:hypothetical protein
MNQISTNNKIDLLDNYEKYKLDHQDKNDDLDESKEAIALLIDVIFFLSLILISEELDIFANNSTLLKFASKISY